MAPQRHWRQFVDPEGTSVRAFVASEQQLDTSYLQEKHVQQRNYNGPHINREVHI